MLDRYLRQLWAFLVMALLAGPSAAQSFVAFESGPVRPIALSPDGTRLYVTNIPDNRLEIFRLTGDVPNQIASVPVGLEPVAVAVRSNAEVWVANHLSDSVSVVDVAADPPRVVRTLLVGDEPRDIVFAGSGGNRAFVTTAHRGQNVPFDPQLLTQSVPRCDVWVFDATTLGDSLGGDPLGIVHLYGDTPRGLAASPDGSKVYVAVFHSGNGTAALNEALVTGVVDAGANSRLPPLDNVEGVPAPHTGIIVRQTPGGWVDATGQSWTPFVPFSLPDWDLFELNANAAVGTMASTAVQHASVGTILFNIATDAAGKVYVSNTEAQNHLRFEGPGVYAATQGVAAPTTLRGHLHESRITVIDGATVTPRHLNPHIDYATEPVPAGVKERSLALPLDMAISGSTLYVAAFGSSKVGVFDTAELAAGTFVPDEADHIQVTGGGPAGLALDAPNDRLYVYTRFDDAISVVDLGSRSEVAKVALHSPEPPDLVAGRPFLYDASLSSDRGDSSCASCHVFSRMDDLAWNLGDPDGTVTQNHNTLIFSLDLLVPDVLTPEQAAELGKFHPMKGPMTTQTLKGMVDHGPMHWRGDRTGADPNDPNAFLDPDPAFRAFNVAFDGLLGGSMLEPAQMQAFTDFVLQLTLPPNPVANLDGTLSPIQQAGRDFYMTALSAGNGLFTCNDCHTLDPPLRFFGATGLSSFDGETQLFKIAHLRNMYQKVGMFGLFGVTAPTGPQIRGFGYIHDGSVDNLLNFLTAGNTFQFSDPNTQPQQVAEFMFAFPSNLAPVVGHQVTRHTANATAVLPRIALLKQRASLATPESDLVVRGVIGGAQRGWLLDGPDSFRADAAAEPALDQAGLLALADAESAPLTFLAVPPGSGERVALDRDEDGALDGDDNCPLFANALQGDGDSDDRGDLCECGDQSGDGTLAGSDLDEIADCLTGGIACAELCDADHDGACSATDVTAVQLDLLSLGRARCARSPLP